MTDREALIEEARRWPSGVGPIPSAPPANIIKRLADALESTLAELRQERERADKYQDLTRRTELQCQDVEAALSRAEETIESTLAWLRDDRFTVEGRAIQAEADLAAYLTDYDKQKEGDHD